MPFIKKQLCHNIVAVFTAIVHNYPIRTRQFIKNKPAAQNLPDATAPIGQIHLFSKMTITSEPHMGF